MFYQKIKSDSNYLTISTLTLILVLSLIVHNFVISGQTSLEGMMYSLLGIMASIVVTTFSFVFVALQLASVQFSPRIMRSFFEFDHFSRFFLWIFLSFIAYNLTLIFLGITSSTSFFSKFGVIGGATLSVLIFPLFIHHVAENINASSITKSITLRTLSEIDSLYDKRLPSQIQGNKFIIYAKESGYLDSVNTQKLEVILSNTAFKKFRIIPHVGSFVLEHSPLIEIETDDKNQFIELIISIRKLLKISKFRSYTQDVMFGVRQLVDIAIKAISPAINDPTTALNCIDYLGVIVSKIAESKDDSKEIERLKSKNIFIREFTFEQLIDTAFDQIYQWGKADYIVVRHLIRTITMMIQFINSTEKLKVLINQIDDMEFDFLHHEATNENCIFQRKEHRESIRDFMDEYYEMVILHAPKFDDESLNPKIEKYKNLRISLAQNREEY
jgi:uncharacterized membrane protein